MKRLLPALAVLTATALTLASGIIHGRASNRWGRPDASTDAAERLDRLPDNFGKWIGQPHKQMHGDTYDVLREPEYILREFVHQQTGEVVQAAIILGAAGPISVHDPEICYSSRDRVIREKWPVDIGEHGFSTVTFQSTRLDKTFTRVYYAWTVDGKWSRGDDSWLGPRWAFAGSPYLYKLQLACEVPPGADLPKSDACLRFLQEFLKQVPAHLAGAPSN